ncbi:MAG: PEPxxWA-CTERM sorting domain-containing protein [Polymorphobacter sp.]
MTIKMKLALAAIVLAMPNTAQAAVNLVVNGDFSQPVTGGGWGLFDSIPGWFSESGDTLEVGNAGVYGASCNTPSCQLLELNANRFGSVSQVVTGLHVGSSYELGWSMAGRNDGGPQLLDVFLDGQQVSGMASNGFAGWVDTVRRFTATSSSVKINFASRDAGGNQSYGNLISDVSVAGVPEPSSWLMMITGFGMVGVAVRRRDRLALA